MPAAREARAAQAMLDLAERHKVYRLPLDAKHSCS